MALRSRSLKPPGMDCTKKGYDGTNLSDWQDDTKTIIVNNISLFFSVCILLLFILASVS